MEVRQVLLLVVVFWPQGFAENAEVNPLSKVTQLMTDLKAKVVADGEAEEKAYKSYEQWCGSSAAEIKNDIKVASASVDKLTAKVAELTSDIEVADTKIGELSASTSKEEAELKEATSIRKKEEEEFREAEKELMSSIDTLERSISVLEKESGPGGSLAQIDTSSLTNVLQSLSAVADAAALSGEGKEQLSALLQTREENGDDAEAEDSDDDVGAPSAAKYKKKTGSVIDVMEDMKDKAESQLADLRKSEMNSKHSYELLKQSLEDSTAAESKELDAQKAAKAQGAEDKASTEGDLEVAKKEKAAAIKKNSDLEATCQASAADHQANVLARKAEVDTLDQAMKIVAETTGGAEEELYSSSERAHPGGAECEGLSFLQVAARSRASSSVVDRVRNLARQHHSKALAQLASKIAATMKYSNRDDPFAKVKALVVDMIAKLEKQQSEEAQEKAYCDEEMAKTKTKYDDLQDSVASLTAKIDTMASKSAKLKEEAADLQKQIAVMVKEQADSDKLRRCAHAAFMQAKADLELGLSGVRKAMTVLRTFYGTGEEDPALLQDSGDAEQMTSMMQEVVSQPAPPEKFEKAKGAGGGILGVLEVIESDLAKNLATEDTQESDSASSYEKTTQAFKVNKAEKEQDVKYKTQEHKSLDKSIAELESDKATDNDELTAVTEYYGKLKERCIAKPDSYEERKAKREAEIEGLKDALTALENEALVQFSKRAARRGHLRGDTLRTD